MQRCFPLAGPPRLVRGRGAAAALLALAVAVASLVGCGHPATREECEEIFRRSAEIELKSLNVHDPAEVKRRTTEAHEDRGEQLLEQCIGRRITNRAMGCVRRAETAEELDGCLM